MARKDHKDHKTAPQNWDGVFSWVWDGWMKVVELGSKKASWEAIKSLTSDGGNGQETDNYSNWAEHRVHQEWIIETYTSST
jgi:hypothetical protein